MDPGWSFVKVNHDRHGKAVSNINEIRRVQDDSRHIIKMIVVASCLFVAAGPIRGNPQQPLLSTHSGTNGRSKVRVKVSRIQNDISDVTSCNSVSDTDMETTSYVTSTQFPKKSTPSLLLIVICIGT